MTYPSSEKHFGPAGYGLLDPLEDLPLRRLQSLPCDTHSQKRYDAPLLRVDDGALTISTTSSPTTRSIPLRRPSSDTTSETSSTISVLTPGLEFVKLPRDAYGYVSDAPPQTTRYLFKSFRSSVPAPKSGLLLVPNAPMMKDLDSFTDATEKSALFDYVSEHVAWPHITPEDASLAFSPERPISSIEAWRRDVHVRTDSIPEPPVASEVGPVYLEDLPRAVNRRFLSTYSDCPLPPVSSEPTWRPRATSSPPALSIGFSNLPDMRRGRAP